MKQFNLAYYRREDWPRFLEMISDPERMHEKWEDWEKELKKAEKRFRKEGLETKKVIINLDDLKAYCDRKGIAIDGSARSRYAATLRA